MIKTKIKLINASALSALMLSVFLSCGKPGEIDPATSAKVNGIAKGSLEVLMPAMMGRVMKMVKEDGALKAAEFCNENVGTIGKDLKTQLTEQFTASHKIKSFAMGRTSLKLRNPKNAPAPELKAVLAEWDAAEAKGEKAAPKTIKADKGFYGVIPVRIPAPACLKCHGSESELDKEAYDFIKSKYPEDTATGYKEGDLRGAFWVKVEL
jgi:hypothetical protein